MTRAFEIDPPRADECAAVIANGPSLRGVDLARLPAAATFGMNAAYRHWERIGWHPTHYACLDEVVGLSHAEPIAAMIAGGQHRSPHAFLLRANLVEKLGAIAQAPHVTCFDTLAAGSRMFGRSPVTTGSHTLIWALSLGFKTVFLLGADCNYVEIVPGAERENGNVLRIARPEDNPNYFFADYQRVGDRYHVPNIGGDTHLASWRLAAAVADETGAVVYNLSARSRIGVFDFVSVDDWLSGRALRIEPREAHSGDREAGLARNVTSGVRS
jgi:hypothetical protein